MWVHRNTLLVQHTVSPINVFSPTWQVLGPHKFSTHIFIWVHQPKYNFSCTNPNKRCVSQQRKTQHQSDTILKKKTTTTTKHLVYMSSEIRKHSTDNWKTLHQWDYCHLFQIPFGSVSLLIFQTNQPSLDRGTSG